MINHLLPEFTARHVREVDEIAVDCARNVLWPQHVPDASEASGDIRERMFLELGGLG